MLLDSNILIYAAEEGEPRLDAILAAAPLFGLRGVNVIPTP